MRSLGCLLLLILFATPLLAQPQILYYKFDETSGAIAKNSAVPGQGWDNGSLTGPPIWNTTDPAVAPGALNNTGQNRRMSTGYSLNERNGQPFTIEFWFRTTGGGYQDFCNDSATFGLWLNGGRIQLQTTGGIIVQSTNTNNNDGQWRYCALTRTAGGAYTLYWGTAAAGLSSVTGNSAAAFGTNPFNLLFWSGGTPATYSGQLDEFRLWSEVRSQAQLEADRFTPYQTSSLEVFKSTGAYIKPFGTAGYTNVAAGTFTDFTFNVTNVQGSGTVTFSPVTTASLNGATVSVIANPSSIGPGGSTSFTLRVTPQQAEFDFVVNINNSGSPDPYTFTFQGMMNTGRPEMLYYRFEEGSGNQTRNDASPGRGNAMATFAAGPTWETGTNAQVGNAAVSGNNNNRNLPTGFNGSQLPGPDYTIEFWFFKNNNNNILQTICGDGANFRIYRDGNSNGNHTLRIQTGPVGGDPDINTGASVSNNAWTHFAVVSDPGNFGLRVYRNGVQVFQDLNRTIAFSASQITVFSNGGSGNFTGRMDEFRFWAHARSAAQISANYQNELIGRLEVRRPGVIAHNGTDAIGTHAAGSPAVLNYSLANIGNTGLLLGNPAVSSAAAVNCTVNVTTNPNGALIGPTLTTAAQVEVTPTGVGAFSVQLRFHSNDPDVSPYNVNVTGNATGVAVIQLERPVSTAIAHNGSDNITGLGPVAGMALNYNYTIRNIGLVTLNLTGQSFSANTNCTVSVGAPGSTNVAPGGTTTLPVTVTPGVGGGAFSFMVHVTSNAPAIPTYNINVSGTAAPGGAMQITRGGPAFSNPGNDTAGGTVAGQLTNLNYTLTNIGSGTLGSIAAAQFGAATNCTVNVGTPGASSLLVTQSTGLTVGVTPGIAGGAFSFTLRVTSNDTLNGTFDIVVSGTAAPGGQTQVERLGIIPATTTDTVTGAVAGASTGLTYTIRNIGSGTLSAIVTSATGVPVNIALGGVFAPGSTSLVPAATTTFNVNFTPAAAGAFSFVVRVSSNAAASPYDFTVAGTAAPGGAMQITRGGPAFANPGNDTVGGAIAGQLLNLNYTLTNVGTGTLSSIAAAQFGAASNCTVNVGTPGLTVLSPTQSTGLSVGVTPGIGGGAFSFTLRVTSDDTVNGTFDIFVSGTAAPGGAIQLERSGVIAYQGTDDQTGTLAGVLFGLTYTIRNIGLGTLTLDAVPASVLNAAGCSITNLTQPGALSLAPGATTTFSFDVTPSVAGGSYGFDVEVASNATNHTTFEFSFAETAGVNGLIELERVGMINFGGSDDQAGTLAGVLFGLTYTVRNVGLGTLTLDAAPASVLNAAGCSITNLTQPGTLVLAPGATTTFSFDVTPSIAGGSYGFDVEVASNATNHATFEFSFAETAGVNGQIQLERSGVISFGGTDDQTGTLAGVLFGLTYTVRNIGLGTLTLDAVPASVLNAAGCSITNLAQPGTLVLAPGATTTFSFDVTPAVGGGSYGFDVEVASNATNHATFEFSFAETAGVNGQIQLERVGVISFGGTDDQAGTLAGVLFGLTYTVRNIGLGTLTLDAVPASVLNATGCSITNLTQPGALSLAPGATTTFSFDVTPSIAGGSYGFDVEVASNATNHATFEFSFAETAGVNGQIQLERVGVIAYQGTDDQAGTLAGVLFGLTYTIRNIGLGTLTLDAVPASLLNATGCNITNLNQPGALVLAPGATTTFSFDVTPAVAGGSYGFDVEVASNATNHSTFEFSFAETAGVNGQIQLERVGVISFGDIDDQAGTLAGVLFNLTYTIRNVGLGTLTLDAVPASVLNAAGCSITNLTQPGTLVLAPGATTTFSFDVTPAVGGGSYGFDVEVASNATNHATFEFSFAETAGVNGNIELRRADNSLIGHTGTDTQAGTLAGVSFNRVYTIRNDGPGTLTLNTNPVTVFNQANCTANLLAQPSPLVLAPGATVDFTVQVTPGVAGGGYGYDVEVASNAVNHATFEFSFLETAGVNGQIQLERVGVISFGGTDGQTGTLAGVLFNLTYTVRNVGLGTLTLDAVPASVLNAAGCSITNLTQPGTLSLAPGATTTFSLDVTPAVAGGGYGFDVEVASNATNHATFEFSFAETAGVNGLIELDRTAPILHNGTDAQGGTLAGVQFNLVYTISNGGFGTLTLNTNPVSISGETNCVVNLVAQPSPLVLLPGEDVNFTLQVTPGVGGGSYDFDVSIASNATNHAPFNFSFAATAAAAGGLLVDRGGAILNGGTDTISGAVAGLAISPQLSYTLHNNGSGSVNVSAINILNHSNAVTFYAPYAGTIAPGGQDTWTIASAGPNAAGPFSFDIQILSNDPINPTYTIHVSGVAASGGNMDVQRPAATSISHNGNDTETGLIAGFATTLTYTIQNLGGTSTLDVGTASAPGASQSNCTVSIASQPTPGALAINATTTFQVQVTPTTPGVYSFVLEVTSDDPAKNPYIITFSATALAPAAIDAPPSAGFGASNLGIGVPQTVQLDSVGGVDLIITSVQVIGAHAGDWQITSAVPQPGSVSVNPGSFFDVDLVFTPSALLGRTAQLEIISNHTGTPGTFTYVDLTGTGTTGNLTTNLTVNYPDTVATQTSPPVNHVLANGGSGPARITAVSPLGGANPGAWQLTNLPSFPHTVASGGMYSITGEFTPPGVGTYTAEFTVTWDNGPGTGPFTLNVQLDGDGISGLAVTGVVVAPDNGGPVEIEATVSGPPGSFIDVAVTYTGGLSPGPASVLSAGSLLVIGNVIHDVPANTQLVLFWNAYATEGHHSAADYVVTLTPSIGVNVGAPGSSAMFALNRQGGWTSNSPGAMHLPIADHCMIHDEANNRLIVFGGVRAGLFLDEVWAFDLAGASWQPLHITGPAPSARRYAAAAYDGARNRMLVFGGAAGNIAQNDTWALDLTPGSESWTQIAMTSPATPSGRNYSSLVVDPANDRAVLYGGAASTGTSNEVWVLNLLIDEWGTGPVTIAGTTPGGLRAQAAVWDVAGNRMIVHGGMRTSHFNRVWSLELDPTPVWTLLLSSGPSARSYHAHALDTSRRSLVIQGGAGGGGAAAIKPDCWRLDLNTMVWEQLADEPASAGGRYLTAGAYDPVGDRFLVLGGRDGTTSPYHADLVSISLSGTPAWQAPPDGPDPAAGPMQREGAVMVVNAAGNRLYVWGGREGAKYYDELYECNLTTGAWSVVNVGTPRPSARAFAGWMYDPANDRLILTGGVSPAGIRVMDVWSLDLSGAPAWTEWSTTAGPSPRYDHAIAYDAAGDRLYLFGGIDTTTRDDLWVLEAGVWSQPSVLGPMPGARSGHGAVFDSANSRFVVYLGTNGNTRTGTIFELDVSGTPTWADITPGSPAPTPRARFGAAPDHQGSAVWLHGGQESTIHVADQWLLDLGTAGAAAWTQIVTPLGPTHRQRHAACMDAAGTWYIGFGQKNTLTSRDIWRIDTGNTAAGWTTLDQSDSPKGLSNAFSALDENSNRLIVFGGEMDDRVTNGLFALDLNSAGGTWQRLTPTGTAPGSRMAGSMVYDNSGAYPRMILFGGRAHQYVGYSNSEVWELDLTPGAEAWTQLSTSFVGSTNNPGVRSWHTAFIDNLGRMIVFGGAGSSDSRQNSVFALDLNTLVWTRLAVSGGPPPTRMAHGACYDNLGGRNRMLVFGGVQTALLNDTWEFDLNTNTWTQLATGIMPALHRHSMVIDPVRGRMLAFGGINGGSTATCGLYEFDLATDTWSVVSTGTHVPQHRFGHTALWDVGRSRMVILGGNTHAHNTITQSGGLSVSLWFWGD